MGIIFFNNIMGWIYPLTISPLTKTPTSIIYSIPYENEASITNAAEKVVIA